MLRSALILFLALTATARDASEVMEVCLDGAKGADDGTCAHTSPQGNSLIQRKASPDRVLVDNLTKVDADQHDEIDLELSPNWNLVGQMRPMADIISYFQDWAQGEIEHRLEGSADLEGGHIAASLLDVEASLTESYVANVLGSIRESSCPHSIDKSSAGGWSRNSTSLGQNWKLHSSSTDAKGVQHALLLSTKGQVHYVALHQGRVLVSQPPACPSVKTSSVEAISMLNNLSSEVRLDQRLQKGFPKATEGEAEPIGVEDLLVEHTVDYFKKYFASKCKVSEPVIIPLTAEVEVMDPLEAIVFAEVNEECVTIKASYKYEETTENPVGLIETSNDSDDTPIWELAKFVDLFVDGYGPETICSLGHGQKQSCLVADLMEVYRFGDNSKEKAHQWEVEMLPTVQVDSQIDISKESVDLRQVNTECFPGSKHKKVIRNQGNCGSCWAFASATTAMHNLCASDPSASQKPDGGRREVSVQQIMSCNSYKMGCKGGNVLVSKVAWVKEGLDREMDAPYQCASGNPLNHFDAGGKSCKKFPWGKSCDTRLTSPNWNFYETVKASDERTIRTIMSMGQALYMRFDVYASFMKKTWHHKIYTGPKGRKKGGHAVSGIGYGVLNGVKYWLLQNSWGAHWNEDGYFKFIRGKNFAGIEKGGWWIRVDTKDGTPSPQLGSGPSPPAPTPKKPSRTPAPTMEPSSAPTPAPREKPSSTPAPTREQAASGFAVYRESGKSFCKNRISGSRSKGKTDCQNRCSANPKCKYYSLWLTGGRNYCRLSTDCSTLLDSRRKASIAIYKKQDPE